VTIEPQAIPPEAVEVPRPEGQCRITIKLKRSELKTFLFLLPDYALEYLQVEFPTDNEP
jgi:hypothetical protein